MNAYYELKKNVTGQYIFNLKAGNHETILSSESYPAEQTAREGIAAVQKNGPLDSAYVKKTASNGQFYFTLKGANGEPLGRSEMYTTEAARDHGIASVKQNSPTGKIVEK